MKKGLVTAPRQGIIDNNIFEKKVRIEFLLGDVYEIYKH